MAREVLRDVSGADGGHQSFPLLEFHQTSNANLPSNPSSAVRRRTVVISDYIFVCVDNFICHSETALASLRTGTLSEVQAQICFESFVPKSGGGRL